MLIDSVEEKKDLWLVYELCPGQTMGEHMFDVKGEFYKGERVYMVNHGVFYHAIRNNLDLMRDFLARMCDALGTLAKLSIVHADLKPDNVIVDYDAENQRIKSLKIIDLGSSFLLNPEGHVVENQQEFAASTPEYLPPEIQSFLAKRFTQEKNVKVDDYDQISYIFDMWSLGSILVEILSGFPLWLSLKSRVRTLDNRSVMNVGLFGVAGRDNAKICKKQHELLGHGIQQLMKTLRNGFDFTGQALTGDKQFVDLL
jgi:dual specificity tyrosine-phosphorylation-regulated kinase 2/3/4